MTLRFIITASLSLLAALLLPLEGATAHIWHNHDHDHDRELQDSVRCGTEEISLSRMVISEQRIAMHQEMHGSPHPEQTITVGVYWHDIQLDDGTGGINQTMRDDQMTVLNNAFASAGFSFTIIANRSFPNTAWYGHQLGSADGDTMRNTLHQGTNADLNIWSCVPVSTSGATLLGYATFPDEFETNPGLDGVVYNLNSSPGGALSGVNEGDTLVHEVGHWLFLYHVFAQPDGLGCSGTGDLVDDTPPQITQSSGNTCPTDQDSCPDQPGFDSTNNYMDYSDDVCMVEFTAGQISRMQSSWATYRASGTPSPTSAPPTVAPTVLCTPCPTAPCNLIVQNIWERASSFLHYLGFL